jgi:hypothetical protein
MPRREGQPALPANETSGPSPSANAQAIPNSSDASTTVRTKIQERLHQVVREAPLTKNRSPELIPLMQEYEGMRKKCKLIHSVAAGRSNTRENPGWLNSVKSWCSYTPYMLYSSYMSYPGNHELSRHPIP